MSTVLFMILPESLLPQLSGNEVSHLTNGLTTPFAALVNANWQRFGNIKLFVKARAN